MKSVFLIIAFLGIGVTGTPVRKCTKVNVEKHSFQPMSSGLIIQL
jgi:hypothetical protein